MSSFFDVPVDAVYHLVSGLTGFLTPVLAGVAAVAAIVLFTAAVRAVLVPLSFRAMRGQAVQARLAPELQALRTRYAKQPERLQREMTALYKREGTSLFAGITPLLLQWPLLSVVYILFRSPLVAGKPNVLLSHDLLGVPLGMHWLSGAGAASLQGLVFLGVFAILAALCWLSARLSRLMTATGQASPPPAPGAAGALVRVLPYLTVAFAAFVPLAAGVYLITSVAWSLGERAFFWRSRGRGSGAWVPQTPIAGAGGPQRPLAGAQARAASSRSGREQGAEQPNRR
jgi:YidC/Oxa1 family membrane protein insertase